MVANPDTILTLTLTLTRGLILDNAIPSNPISNPNPVTTCVEAFMRCGAKPRRAIPYIAITNVEKFAA